MIDMKRPKKKMDEGKEVVSEYEPYPWGLRITLEEEELSKLGISVNDFKMGSKGKLNAEYEITSLSINENTDSKKRSESVGLQIQKIELQGMKKSKYSEYKQTSNSIGGMTGK